jgi:hypothetical protein
MDIALTLMDRFDGKTPVNDYMAQHRSTRGEGLTIAIIGQNIDCVSSNIIKTVNIAGDHISLKGPSSNINNMITSIIAKLPNAKLIVYNVNNLHAGVTYNNVISALKSMLITNDSDMALFNIGMNTTDDTIQGLLQKYNKICVCYSDADNRFPGIYDNFISVGDNGDVSTIDIDEVVAQIGLYISHCKKSNQTMTVIPKIRSVLQSNDRILNPSQDSLNKYIVERYGPFTIDRWVNPAGEVFFKIKFIANQDYNINSRTSPTPQTIKRGEEHVLYIPEYGLYNLLNVRDKYKLLESGSI